MRPCSCWSPSSRTPTPPWLARATRYAPHRCVYAASTRPCARHPADFTTPTQHLQDGRYYTPLTAPFRRDATAAMPANMAGRFEVHRERGRLSRVQRRVEAPALRSIQYTPLGPEVNA
ncbi:hypothetical protein PHYSODRAFT_306173 [Phytophthora sojae]|uniref:Uncharacterized protein n=1 Tax=Phytophthora sojae (strain P6497) TaxID=1094619 RepID=G5A876_PHYSP|nr:hypothetical protein PHYSODRAFT_306173 [Phytophthora sojae]EGZ08102.1 hypothetical protein PHYSODRAFT_306173 [Phytophthora sojae]|eukprot:XP_009536274.1 hypothetical protein PHYSODRAFT_306173 [Phytophthora sojae]